MFYLDSQRTTTRRDSSLVFGKTGDDRIDFDILSTRNQSVGHFNTEIAESDYIRPRGSVRKDLITIMFESMLEHIVESWEVIASNSPSLKLEDDSEKLGSEQGGRGKKRGLARSSKARRSRSKIELSDSQAPTSFITFPEERVIIQFRNGNIYEGNIAMKCMNGSGRFQWADGTVYLGNFKCNEITGHGVIYWKDDTWYEGDFADNLRHGSGVFVDSRRQRSYIGEWHLGTKHGHGVIYYSGDFTNSYDGEWVHNIRHGFGIREYCPLSGYKGDWDYYVRDGKGFMIWPNQDFYKGGWKNSVMSGYGVYIWNNHGNKTMSMPSLNIYRGQWLKGLRNGYGVMHFGLIHGAFYKGEFKDNKKNGVGKLVTNSGQVIMSSQLFQEDILTSLNRDEDDDDCKKVKNIQPIEFKLCDVYIGLADHIEQAVKNIDRKEDERNILLSDFIENNKIRIRSGNLFYRKSFNQSAHEQILHKNIKDFVLFEKESLRKAIVCYEINLKNIYYKYAALCNIDNIHFTPILIRLYLWQLYYDCNVHEKGLNLVEIDNIFYQKPEWHARTPHNPFEKIYFCQFVHGLISIAIKLYGNKCMPGKKPATIVAEAFRNFMDKDVLPGSGVYKGKLYNSFGWFIPLRPLYELYCQIGEPHNIRQFMVAMRHVPSDQQKTQPNLVNATDEEVPVGHNAYIIGDEMTFIADDPQPIPREYDEKYVDGLPLYNLANLSSKTILKIIGQVFPQLYREDKLTTVDDIYMTFFEFFEIFINCVEESVRVKEEEMRWREKMCVDHHTSHGILPSYVKVTRKDKP